METAGTAPTAATSGSVGHGGDDGGGSVFFLPFPGAQGHTNPMLQFGQRLAYHGLRPTLVVTRYVLSATEPPGSPFRVAAISDGFDDGGMASCPDNEEYFSRMEAVGSETLRELLLAEACAGRPVRVLVYDPHLAWARPIAQAAGVATAAFFSQPCAVDIVYGELFAGRMALPATDGRELVARGALSVELESDDMPPFVAFPEWQPVFTKTSIRQFEGLEDADDVLVNSFHDFEPKRPGGGRRMDWCWARGRSEALSGSGRYTRAVTQACGRRAGDKCEGAEDVVKGMCSVSRCRYWRRSLVAAMTSRHHGGGELLHWRLGAGMAMETTCSRRGYEVEGET